MITAGILIIYAIGLLVIIDQSFFTNNDRR